MSATLKTVAESNQSVYHLWVRLIHVPNYLLQPDLVLSLDLDYGMVDGSMSR